MSIRAQDVRRTSAISSRRWPIGAELAPGGGVSFRVWAPNRKRVEVVTYAADSDRPLERLQLTAESGGYWSGRLETARAGSWYGFHLDGDSHRYPDPMSRFQPRGPHGPSEVVDPGSFRWTDAGWPGVTPRGQVHYEMHIGTFTREGTWQAAIQQLPELANLGITVLEVMPVADFPGRFGWGYDGVNLFAPTRLYGVPDDFRAFVNRAHELGMGVILDIVYNHIGPDGNYLPAFSESYFTDRYKTDWGRAINFDGDDAGPVREFYLTNAAYWISEFHLDGFRLDATQDIHDESPDHILAAVARAVRQAAGERRTIIVAENEEQNVRHVLPQQRGGFELDGMWNDDFHHAAHAALSSHREAYYSDYFGTPQELVSALKHGFLFQGQRSAWQKKPRGTAARGLSPEIFVTFLQNHDQVANSFDGRRCNAVAGPGRYRALTAVMLLGPGTPLLFQGQEFASSSPFLFFADHHPELARMVREGRKEFLSQFPSIAVPEVKEQLPDPGDPATFERCKLDFAERTTHADIYRMHRDLLRLRREDPVLSSHARHGLDGAVLAEQAFVMRFFGVGDDDRLLVVNLGCDLTLRPAPQPLLAPPPAKTWQLLWSSEDASYGGGGTPPVDSAEGWNLPGQAAVVLRPVDPPP